MLTVEQLKDLLREGSLVTNRDAWTLAERVHAAIASAPQASQPPQGAVCKYAEEIGLPPHACMDCSYDPMELEARFKKPALAAPPQGAASPLTDDSAAGSNFEQELRSGGRWSPEMIERVAGAESAIFNAISAYTPPGTHSATASPLPAPQEPAAESVAPDSTP